MYFRSQTLSRSAYAKLYTAGFPQIVDRRGEPPDVVDPADKMNFMMVKEEADKFQANEVILQFLAYSRYVRGFILLCVPNKLSFLGLLQRVAYCHEENFPH